MILCEILYTDLKIYNLIILLLVRFSDSISIRREWIGLDDSEDYQILPSVASKADFPKFDALNAYLSVNQVQ